MKDKRNSRKVKVRPTETKKRKFYEKKIDTFARRLNSSRPRPISSIRSPRRNPERRLRSVEHHLGPSVLATISGTTSALCSPDVPATVAAVLLRHSPLWPATSTTRTLGIPSPWSSLPAVRSRAPKP